MQAVFYIMRKTEERFDHGMSLMISLAFMIQSPIQEQGIANAHKHLL